MPVFYAQDKLHYFAHVPKCGGTSIEAYLRSRFGRLGFSDDHFYDRAVETRWTKGSPQHILWKDLENLVPTSWITSAFAVVRCPLRRVVSAYNSYVEIGVVRWQSFSEFITSNTDDGGPVPYRLDNHLVRQTEFLPPEATLFRLEDGMAPVAMHLAGLGGYDVADAGAEISHLNATKSRGRQFEETELKQSDLDLVWTTYEQDFAALGYEMPQNPPLVYVPNEKPPFGIRSALRRKGLLPARTSTS